MIKNLKYRLCELFTSRQVRIGGSPKLMACTLAAVTLLGCPIHTEKIFNEQNYIRVVSYTATAESSFPVYVTCGEETVTVDFTKGTVADALKLAGFTPDGDDFTQPSPETEITDTLYIDYMSVDYVTGSYTEAIAYSTKTVYDRSKEKGYTSLSTEGVNGVQEVAYTEKLINGVSQGKTVTETKVITEPQDAVKVVGAKVNKNKAYSDIKKISTLSPDISITLDEQGVPTNYTKKMTVRATAYTYTGNNCATGVAPQPGYIAVNPKVIPYGTKLYIKSPDGSIIYGYAVAADTGGFIKKYPNGIDLFMSTEGACTNFGVRQMEIYILE